MRQREAQIYEFNGIEGLSWLDNPSPALVYPLTAGHSPESVRSALFKDAGMSVIMDSDELTRSGEVVPGPLDKRILLSIT